MQVYRSTDYIQFRRIHVGLHNQRSTRRSTEYREVYRIQGGLQITWRGVQNTWRYMKYKDVYRIHGAEVYIVKKKNSLSPPNFK